MPKPEQDNITEKNEQDDSPKVNNQKDIEQIVASDLGLTRKEVKRVIDKVLLTIHDKVEDNEVVRFQGFGRFYLSERSEHPARNLRTGEDIIIGRHHAIRFSPSRMYAKRLRLKTQEVSDQTKTEKQLD
ncbi:MAG: HU family DNA-binding protein [Aerococcus urinaeequi]